jgi:hypothetical protein
MITIIAVSGWVAFLFVAVLYRMGNKINVEETTALEAFSLALLLSDDSEPLIGMAYKEPSP